MFRLFLKAFLAIVVMGLVAPEARGSVSRGCGEVSRVIDVRGSVKAHVGYFAANSPQGAVIYIQGHEESYRSSRELLTNLCERGFSVAAFDLQGHGTRDADYLRAARKIRAEMSRLRLRTILYGWRHGAAVAARLAKQDGRFSRVILENPLRGVDHDWNYSQLSGRTTRVFACGNRAVKFRGILLTPPGQAPCHPHLSQIPEALHPLLEFIETDFSGVPASSWYWRARRA